MRPHMRFSLLLEEVPTGPQKEAVRQAYGEAELWCHAEAGIGIVEVVRFAPSLGEAIAAAIRDLEAVGLKPIGVAQDDVARPLVATAACLALDLRSLPLDPGDRMAIGQLITA